MELDIRPFFFYQQIFIALSVTVVTVSVSIRPYRQIRKPSPLLQAGKREGSSGKKVSREKRKQQHKTRDPGLKDKETNVISLSVFTGVVLPS